MCRSAGTGGVCFADRYIGQQALNGLNEFRITLLADLTNHCMEISKKLKRHTERRKKITVHWNWKWVNRKEKRQKNKSKVCKWSLHEEIMLRLCLPNRYTVMQRGLAHCQGQGQGTAEEIYLHVEHHEFIGQTVSVLNINHLFVHQRLKTTASRLATHLTEHCKVITAD